VIGEAQRPNDQGGKKKKKKARRKGSFSDGDLRHTSRGDPLRQRADTRNAAQNRPDHGKLGLCVLFIFFLRAFLHVNTKADIFQKKKKKNPLTTSVDVTKGFFNRIWFVGFLLFPFSNNKSL
jgi:hypothetical protein